MKTMVRKIEIRKFARLIFILQIASVIFMGIPIILINGINTGSLLGILFFVLFWFVILVGGVIVNKVINLYYNKKDETGYYREIPKEYSVAIASLIYDNNFEASIDIPAVILSLISKGVLIYCDKKKVETVQNENLEKLDNHEKYIWDCINDKVEIKFEQFKELVIKDAANKNLIIIRSGSINEMNMRLLMCFFIMIIGCMLFSLINDTICAIFFVLSFVAFIVIFKIENQRAKNLYYNTRLGNEEKKKIQCLKNFLIDFSEIDQKEMKHAAIWEEYLAYAYMFGINDNIFKSFLENENYENLFNTEYDFL